MVTGSPVLMPSFLGAVASWPTSRCRFWLRSTRESPGSPSKMIAALLPRPAAMCRSRQLKLTLSLPPTNHLANGSVHSSTLAHFLAQASGPACSAQKRSGASLARLHSASYCARLLGWPFASNLGGGEKLG